MGMGAKRFSVHDFVYLYCDEKRVMAFHRKIGIFSTEHEEDVILKPCSKRDRVNMVVADDSLIRYFYFHFPVICDLGVLINFTLFEVEFLTIVNVAPSEIMPNVWGIIRAFEMLCLLLVVPPTIRVSFSFYSVRPTPQMVG